MNKIRVIDLLNKIANGEEVPKKIKYKNNILYYDDDYTKEYPPTFNYYDEKGNNGLIEGWLCQYINDEVEVIEKNKIKKMIKLNNISDSSDMTALCAMQWKNNNIIEKKIKEIIDYINKGDKE